MQQVESKPLQLQNVPIVIVVVSQTTIIFRFRLETLIFSLSSFPLSSRLRRNFSLSSIFVCCETFSFSHHSTVFFPPFLSSFRCRFCPGVKISWRVPWRKLDRVTGTVRTIGSQYTMDAMRMRRWLENSVAWENFRSALSVSYWFLTSWNLSTQILHCISINARNNSAHVCRIRFIGCRSTAQ